VDNSAKVKRRWQVNTKFTPQERDYNADVDDCRVQKSLQEMYVAHVEALAELLYASAVAFNHINEDHSKFKIRHNCVDLRVNAVKAVCDDVGSWFQLLTSISYDATFGLQELLDFLIVFLDGWQREDAYKVKFCSVGLFLTNRGGRQLWVQTIEQILYNYNVLTKFKLPSRFSKPLQTLDYFSWRRTALPAFTVPFSYMYSTAKAKQRATTNDLFVPLDRYHYPLYTDKV